MMSLESWWWPKRPVRVPKARTAGLLAGLGAALFGVSAVLLKTGTLGWDESLFRLLMPLAPLSGAAGLTHNRRARMIALICGISLQPVALILLWFLGYP